MIYCSSCFAILHPEEDECPCCLQKTKEEFNLDEEIELFLQEHDNFDIDTLIETFVSSYGIERSEIRRYIGEQ